MAPFRPLDFESEFTAGITATSKIEMITITTSISTSVKAPGAGRGISAARGVGETELVDGFGTAVEFRARLYPERPAQRKGCFFPVFGFLIYS